MITFFFNIQTAIYALYFTPLLGVKFIIGLAPEEIYTLSKRFFLLFRITSPDVTVFKFQGLDFGNYLF